MRFEITIKITIAITNRKVRGPDRLLRDERRPREPAERPVRGAISTEWHGSESVIVLVIVIVICAGALSGMSAGDPV
jgi:hypothetical protein